MTAIRTPRTSAIILAGRRANKPEPLAESHGVSDKCLVPVDGRPLIEHVVETLSTSPLIDRIIVSINDPAIIADLPLCKSLLANGRMKAIPASGNLADSVLDAAKETETPVLITTADNVLFTHDAIANMLRRTRQTGADAAVAFARKEDILAAHPDGQRRFYGFSDGGFSNCNCYWIGNPKSLKAAEIFRSGGQFAKNPLRIATLFGVINLLRFRFGLGTLAGSMQRVSKRLGMNIVPVIMDDGRLAIDVDNERTHRVVTEILERRDERQMAA